MLRAARGVNRLYVAADVRIDFGTLIRACSRTIPLPPSAIDRDVQERYTVSRDHFSNDDPFFPMNDKVRSLAAGMRDETGGFESTWRPLGGRHRPRQVVATCCCGCQSLLSQGLYGVAIFACLTH